MSSRTTPAAVAQNSRRSAPLPICLLRLALDAQPRVRERVQPVEADVLAALLALAEFLGGLVQAAQRLVHVPEVAPFLRGEQKRFLALHRIGALVGHVERIAREVPVRRLQAGVERLAVVPQLLHDARPLLEQSLLEVLELFLAEAAFGLGFRRHYRVPPFRPSCRRSAMVTCRPSISTARVMSASSKTLPSTVRRASVSPSTYP